MPSGSESGGPSPVPRPGVSLPAAYLSLCSSGLGVDELLAELQTVREECLSKPDLVSSVSAHGLPLSPPGASQATNRENIQKAISRLDEDLTTLGQMSKLSESLGFPHQVCALCLRLGERGGGASQTLSDGERAAFSFA